MDHECYLERKDNTLFFIGSLFRSSSVTLDLCYGRLFNNK